MAAGKLAANLWGVCWTVPTDPSLKAGGTVTRWRRARWRRPAAVGKVPANPQSWNRYSYSLNNPLSYIDPDGEEPIKIDNPNAGIPPNGAKPLAPKIHMAASTEMGSEMEALSGTLDTLVPTTF